MDGTPEQQTRETRTPLPARPGQPAAYDLGYGRNGTANLFMVYAPLDAWRHAGVTDRRRRRALAWLPVDMADVHLPGRRVVLVMDNLNTHRLSTLYEAFPPAEASRPADRSGVHHTPKHGSWPDMAETGTGVLSRQCLDRRIPDRGDDGARGRRMAAAPERLGETRRLAVRDRGRADQAEVPLPGNSMRMGY